LAVKLEEKKVKWGLIQIALVIKQLFGTTDTFCINCGKKISFKRIREDGSYTQLCDCGCNLIQYHKPDEFHKMFYFTRKFIPKKKYDPNYKNKSELEKIGFEKKIIDNKTIFVK
jgi:hypothetical protein